MRAGDILLVADKTFVSRLIQWKLNSRWSHCIPVVSPTAGLNVIYGYKSRIINIQKEFLIRNFRILRLRPKNIDTVKFITRAKCLEGIEYDISSYLGFAFNKRIQSKKKLNCAEATLHCCHAAGILNSRNMDRISPQSFFEFASAGLFEMERVK